MTNTTQQLLGLLMQAGTQSAPTNLTLPSISGTPQQGNVLSGSPGTWQGVPSPQIPGMTWWSAPPPSYSTWTQISPNSSTYTPVLADVDDKIKIVVTASNGVPPDATAESPLFGPILPAAPTPVPPPPVIT